MKILTGIIIVNNRTASCVQRNFVIYALSSAVFTAAGVQMTVTPDFGQTLYERINIFFLFRVSYKRVDFSYIKEETRLSYKRGII